MKVIHAIPDEIPSIKGGAVESAIRAATVPVMLVFVAPMSGPCLRQMADSLAVARRLALRARIYAVDIEANHQVAARYNIHSIPTLIIFSAAVERTRLIGLQSVDTLVAALNRWALPPSSRLACPESA